MKTVRLQLFCCLGFFALAAGMDAQVGQWRLGREPQRFVLENGLTVILQDDDSAVNSVVQLFIRGGSRDDPPAGSGLAYMTMRLALEIPDQTKLRRLMEFGSSFALHVGEDYSLITIRALSRHLQPTLEILTAIFAEPLFSGMRIDGIKEQMRHLQKQTIDDPNELMRSLTARNFFGISGYGAKLFGDETTLAAISKKDIQAFFDGHFSAANMVAVIISDLDEELHQTIAFALSGQIASRSKNAVHAAAGRQGRTTVIGHHAAVGANAYRLRRSVARAERGKFLAGVIAPNLAGQGDRLQIVAAARSERSDLRGQRGRAAA